MQKYYVIVEGFSMTEMNAPRCYAIVVEATGDSEASAKVREKTNHYTIHGVTYSTPRLVPKGWKPGLDHLLHQDARK